MFLTAAADLLLSLSSVSIVTLKSDFNGNVPLGVAMSNPLVTLLTVLSCIFTATAISFNDKGARKSIPFSRKSVCLLIISAVIFNVVIFLCSNALFNHRADDRAWLA